MFKRHICQNFDTWYGSKFRLWCYNDRTTKNIFKWFKIDESYTLEEIIEYRNKNLLDKIIIPIDKIFSVYPKVVLDKENTYLYKNGVKLNLNQIILNQVKSDVYRVYGYESEFIGLARADYENEIFRVYKNF